jgi:hypothetical protein
MSRRALGVGFSGLGYGYCRNQNSRRADHSPYEAAKSDFHNRGIEWLYLATTSYVRSTQFFSDAEATRACFGWHGENSCYLHEPTRKTSGRRKSNMNFLASPGGRVALSCRLIRYVMKKVLFRQLLTVSLFGIGLMQSARADQGHMENALQALMNARYELSQASHDKGGHRVNAIQIINQAIAEVRRGIRVGASHGD